MSVIYYIFKFLRIWSWFAVITLIFSFLIMFCGFNMYKKTTKRMWDAFIPMWNLLILLDIVKMPRIYFILLLLPVVNVFTIFIMLYRISIVFRTSKGFAFGLILLPVIFMPILNFFKLPSLQLEEEKKNEVSMLTEKDFEKLNTVEDDTPKIDNVFKSDKAPKDMNVPAFKANRVKYEEIVGEMVKDDIVEEKIEKVTPVEVKDIKPNQFINPNISEEDETIEIVEL